MTVEQAADFFARRYAHLDTRSICDVDKRGNRFCEFIIKNRNLESMPVAISITERGCSLSVGQLENITGCTTMTPEQAACAADDVMADRVIFALGYKDDGDIGFGSPFFTRVFAVTGGEDDMTDEYERFVSEISTPIPRLMRPFTSLKGRFTLVNFSGTVNKTVTR